MNEHFLSFEQIRPHLLHSFKHEDQLLKAVGEVGKLFNHYRENLEQYRSDEKLISAYCAYYLTTNYPKLFETLKLLEGIFNIEDYDRVVDVGTGPGTFMLALDKLLPAKTVLEGVDTSSLMLEQARRMLDGLAGERNIALSSKAGASTPDKKTLLMFTHSLNEMGSAKGLAYVEKLDPDAALLIEPGTKESFAKTLELREAMIKKGYNVAYPCFSNAPCPLDLEKDWCHQFIQVSHAEDVERMTQKLHRNRRLLPMVCHLYLKEAPHRQSGSRLIRVKKPTKHSLEWQLCETRGKENFVFDAEVPKRGMSKREIKDLEDVLAGVKVKYETQKEMQDKKRIKLL